MKKLLAYARLQRLLLKRMARYAPFVFLVSLMLCCCLLFALTSLVNADNSAADQRKFTLGVVGDYEDGYLGFGLNAIQSMDSSRFFLELAELEETEAKERLLDGEIVGYIVIPEGFVDNALHGDVGKIRFVAADAPSDIINLFKKEVLALVSGVLVESQNGIYGMREALYSYGISYDVISDMTDEMFLEYAGLILNRSNALEVEIIGVGDHLSFGGYLFTGICVLLILLSGMVCCPVMIRRDDGLVKLMRAKGYGSFVQIIGEYLAYFVLMAVNSTVLLLLLMMGGGMAEGLVPELAGVEVLESLSVLLRFIPAIVLISALQFLLYQLSDSVVSGVLIQFVSTVLLGYASGCFYPINFFPNAIRVVSDVLPTGMARKYFASLITHTAEPWQMVWITVWVGVLLALSCMVRHRSLTKA